MKRSVRSSRVTGPKMRVPIGSSLLLSSTAALLSNLSSEPIAIGFRTLNGAEGLNEVWRFEMGEGVVARLRLYCFTPNVIEAVAKDLSIPALRRPYRSPPY